MRSENTIVATVGVASADVACNSNGECWHTSQKYAVTVYPPELGVQFYGDDWRKSHETDANYKWMKDRDDDQATTAAASGTLSSNSN